MVFFGQTFCQERIAESARKWYIDDPPGVDLSDFGTLESEFPTYLRNDVDESILSAMRRLHLQASLNNSYSTLHWLLF